MLFAELLQYNQAQAAYDKALALRSDLAEAWFGRGNVFARLQRHDEAGEADDRAFALDPALKYLEGDRLHANRFICNWTNLDAETSHLLTGLKEGKLVSSPFVLTSVPASPPTGSAALSSFLSIISPRCRRNGRGLDTSTIESALRICRRIFANTPYQSFLPGCSSVTTSRGSRSRPYLGRLMAIQRCAIASENRSIGLSTSLCWSMRRSPNFFAAWKSISPST